MTYKDVLNNPSQLNEIIHSDYLNFIKDKVQTIRIDEGVFKLYTIDELCQLVTIDDKKMSTIYSLKAYVETLREFLGNFTYDQNGNPFTLLRLALSPVIGSENGNPIFVDYKDKNTIYIFHPDGGDITKTTLTLNKIIKNEY